jgi:hypothetical protein
MRSLQKTLPEFLAGTKNKNRRFHFSSKSELCGFDLSWHIHLPMGSSTENFH